MGPHGTAHQPDMKQLKRSGGEGKKKEEEIREKKMKVNGPAQESRNEHKEETEKMKRKYTQKKQTESVEPVSSRTS